MKIKKNKINFDVMILPELESPEDVGKDAVPGFADAVNEMIEKHGMIGWCTIRVTASIKGLSSDAVCGVAWLGACSYASLEEFMDDSGYYNQLCDDAVRDLEVSFVDLLKGVSRAMVECVDF